MLPSSMAPGLYFWGAIADETDFVVERNEVNNSAVTPIEIVAGPDLAITAVSGPAAAKTGGLLTVTNTVHNFGAGDPGVFTVGFYLSDDNVVTTSDWRVGERMVSGLPPGQSSTSESLVQISAAVPAGKYYLGAVADDLGAVSEVTEANNALVGNVMAVDIGSDLVITMFGAPVTAAVGGSFLITNAIQNTGASDIHSTFSVGFYLSADSIITTSDELIGTRTVSGLGAGQTSATATLVSLGPYGQPGSFYVGAILDPAGDVPEMNEANNTIATPLATVEGADLVMTEVAGPATAQTGTSVLVSNTVANVGAGAAQVFLVAIFLSTDEVITTNDIRAEVRYLGGGLGPGLSSFDTTPVMIDADLAPGTYYWGALADFTGSAPEVNKSNNARSGNRIEIAPGADLIVEDVLGSAVAHSSGSIFVTNTVRNIGGGAAGTSAVGFYLSLDPAITTSDVRVGSRAVSSLAPSARHTESTELNLSPTLTPGAYYLGAIADDVNAVHESNEANNVRVGNPITIVRGPDLVTTLILGPSESAVGEAVMVTNTVVNAGATDINAAFSVGLYLSTDFSITSDRVRVGSRSVAGLAAGQTSSATTLVSLPVNAGAFHWTAVADDTGVIAEVNEANNAFTCDPIEITPIRIDSVRFEGSHVLISFPTVSGRNYRVEQANALVTVVPWIPVPSARLVAGTGGVVTVTHFGAAHSPMLFYRARLLY